VLTAKFVGSVLKKGSVMPSWSFDFV